MIPMDASIAITQAYQSAKGARAFITRRTKRSKLVAFRHNPSPIETTVPRSTMWRMTIAYVIRDADGTARNDEDSLTDKGC